jgi:hypothetical protein
MPLAGRVTAQQRCGNGGSCSVAPADVVAPSGAVASANVAAADEEESWNIAFAPIGVATPPITQFYKEMLGTPAGGANSPRGGESDAAKSVIEQAVGFTPTYPGDIQPAIPFVSNPVPFDITASNSAPDLSKKDNVPKKLGNGNGNGGGGANGAGGKGNKGDKGDDEQDDIGGKGSTGQPPVTATPEPATLTMLATGIVALGSMRRRRKAVAAD